MDSSINLNKILEKHKKWLNGEEGGERYSCPYSADLSGADLSSADLSGSKGMLNPAEFMANNFEHDNLGWIVYKIFGEFKPSPETWKIEPDSIVSETANPDRGTECSSGINFGTLAWIKSNVVGWEDKEIWRCRVHWIDACGIVVPFGTDGKCRCNRLELIEVVKSDET